MRLVEPAEREREEPDPVDEKDPSRGGTSSWFTISRSLIALKLRAGERGHEAVSPSSSAPSESRDTGGVTSESLRMSLLARRGIEDRIDTLALTCRLLEREDFSTDASNVASEIFTGVLE